MEKTKDKKQITTTGVVVPADWDRDGNIFAVAISTPQEEEYLIENDAVGQELLELYGAEVLVTGIASEDAKGNKTIAVKKYELLGHEDEDELADEEEHGDVEDYEGDEYEEDEEQWEE